MLPFQIFPVLKQEHTIGWKKDDFQCVLCYCEDTGRLGAGVTVWTVCALDPSSNPHGDLTKRGTEHSEAIMTYLDALWQSLRSHVCRFGFCPLWGFWDVFFFFFQGGCGSALSPVRGSLEAPGLGIRLCVREKGHLRALEVSTNVARQSSCGPQLKSELHRVHPATG